jgi:two-component system, NtrC family, response regulator GlrR
VSNAHHTELSRPPSSITLPRFAVQVIAGFDVGVTVESVEGRVLVGTAQDCALRLSDPTVSRYHVELEVVGDGIVVRDLGSTNGTLLGAVSVREAMLRADVELQVGRTKIRVLLGREPAALGVSDASSFGALLGASAEMRAVYTALERAAPTTSPVLVTGESGTGKELAAHALHQASPRRDRPFEVVDCGGLPANLIESELFGHERGAFTGATTERAGAFERAHGGTIFLDELGELPLDLQPKLLRVLAEQEVRRIGGSRTRKVDVRIVAATNRDLRREVNAGRFRLDLFYRIAVITVRLPPLRDRLGDLPTLVPALLAQIRRERGIADGTDLDAETLAELANHTWPGNVRELRNWLEQLLVLRVTPSFDADAHAPTATRGGGDEALTALPLKTARELFERRYVETLLAETNANVSEAARRAGVDRVTLFRMIRRFGLRREE